jgi:GAF domain-containing protein
MEIGTEEAGRLASLMGYDILDTDPEARFDRLAELGAGMFNAPIALVALVDGTRAWFKARVGLPVRELPRERAFCDHTIRGAEPFVVLDARLDRRFAKAPLVVGDAGVRFYAGAPLRGADGQMLGAFCVMDRRARRQFSARDQVLLRELAALTMEQLELRRHVLQAQKGLARLMRSLGEGKPQADCQKIMATLTAVQDVVARPARKRVRLITPIAPVASRTKPEAPAAGPERRLDRRRRA